jgi:oligoribonuclease
VAGSFADVLAAADATPPATSPDAAPPAASGG